MVSKSSTGISEKKSLKDYYDLVETLARVEYSRLSSNHLIEFAELVNIGALTVHNVLTTHKNAELNVTYLSTAIKWAIRNELRRRYKWYSLKSGKSVKKEELNNSDKEVIREAVYEAILSIDEMADADNPTQVKDSSASPEDNAAFKELQNSIKEAIKKLPEREKQIIESRFFKGKKLKELSAEYKVSLSRISRIVQSGLDKIKVELKKKNLDQYFDQ